MPETQNATAQAVKMTPSQKTIFDLDSFQEVTIVKEIPDFLPVSSLEEAAARLANNSAKLLEVINRGLMDEHRNSTVDNAEIPWRTFDDEGELNGNFSGTIAEPKAVNSLVLTLAKTVFGYSKEMAKEAKRAAKESAMRMIATTEAIKEGLRKSAAQK
jgi:hypothetical protein